MSKSKRKPAKSAEKKPLIARPRGFLRRWFWRAVLGFAGFLGFAVLFYAVINPPTTPYMNSEARRLGGVDQEWVAFEDIAPVMARSVVAAEDANFCLHWGLDVNAIQIALADGGYRGGSTISQQVVKNVYLWQERSWLRKALEAGITPLVELVWSKRRILEVYLNVAEFDEGVFGVEAAASHYFGVTPAELTPTQAARLAAILPDPKDRSASNPSDYVRRRARQIIDGAATIDVDGRADCFQSADQG